MPPSTNSIENIRDLSPLFEHLLAILKLKVQFGVVAPIGQGLSQLVSVTLFDPNVGMAPQLQLERECVHNQ